MSQERPFLDELSFDGLRSLKIGQLVVEDQPKVNKLLRKFNERYENRHNRARYILEDVEISPDMLRKNDAIRKVAEVTFHEEIRPNGDSRKSNILQEHDVIIYHGSQVDLYDPNYNGENGNYMIITQRGKVYVEVCAPLGSDPKAWAAENLKSFQEGKLEFSEMFNAFFPVSS